VQIFPKRCLHTAPAHPPCNRRLYNRANLCHPGTVMLQELTIKNFAIIDNLRISFDSGMTVLSGETGAGKSIIIKAANLLLGSRATAEVIRAGAENAELEALFQLAPENPAFHAMQAQGFDPAQGLLIRRIISRNNRHRIFINGRLATLQMLTALTENIASISGQHAHQGLLKEALHLELLDRFAGLGTTRDSLARKFKDILPMIRARTDLLRRRQGQDERRALLEFEKEEILQSAAAPGEDRRLEEQRRRLKHAREILELVHGGIESLYGDQGAIADRLGEVRKSMEKAGRLDPALTPVARSLAEIGYQFEDVAQELRSYMNTIELDETRLDGIEARLDRLHKLKRKYGGSLEAVQAHLDSIESELSAMAHLGTDIAALEHKLERDQAELARLARRLSRRRHDAASRLAVQVEHELHALGMAHARFDIQLRPIPAAEAPDPLLTCEQRAVTESGTERAGFRIATNAGEDLKPLASIASGGELSRVVLAAKAILAGTDAVETMIFDEVDAGIGGGVAEVVGEKLAALSRRHQVICITHLPQIAKFADHHFRISKFVRRGRTCTRFGLLDDTQRVNEMARMLGGREITETTLAHAREILEAAARRSRPAAS